MQPINQDKSDFYKMNNDSIILVLEDDPHDVELLQSAFRAINLKRNVVFFRFGQELINYLVVNKRKPFLIMSDVNVPRLNGFETRNKIYDNPELDLKGVPYIFFSTSYSQAMQVKVMERPYFGFFVKPILYNDLISTVKKIIDYWQMNTVCELYSYQQ